ncbi:competence/damage-inducible protein A [Sulfurimonas lithotrophica]|uniref:Competence/damage-inducible protein A n=1 Tax=Sulfurimonas lithotrophica TaxID=2590022 RepID=A0A5P8NXU5_9BACT|nr:molybdopterin-binding protein [Sulfurimonas lithotrophica]QFR48226.1 competence/damage-inducible protein A [Sulfurimonas lithotrophica]
MNFYAVIIGTEILNSRREDKHFDFLKKELAKYGHELFASFIIKDDKTLIKNTYEMIKKDENAILFSFGGIGSTPDDLTREIAAEIFTSKPLQTNEKFKQDILDRFGAEAYPHRIHMADIPVGSELIFNPVNNMSAFSLENRFFFVPGFPSMAHPMLESVIAKNFSVSKKKYRYTLLAKTSENTLITLMNQVPDEVELSSLPMFKNNKASVELSLSGYDKTLLEKYFDMFENELSLKNIDFKKV